MCFCGDLYCNSCGPAQGAFKCEHRRIQGDCEVKGCPNYGGPCDPDKNVGKLSDESPVAPTAIVE